MLESKEAKEKQKKSKERKLLSVRKARNWSELFSKGQIVQLFKFHKQQQQQSRTHLFFIVAFELWYESRLTDKQQRIVFANTGWHKRNSTVSDVQLLYCRISISLLRFCCSGSVLFWLLMPIVFIQVYREKFCNRERSKNFLLHISILHKPVETA